MLPVLGGVEFANCALACVLRYLLGVREGFTSEPSERLESWLRAVKAGKFIWDQENCSLI